MDKTDRACSSHHIVCGNCFKCCGVYRLITLLPYWLKCLTAIKPYRPLSLDYTCPVGFEYPKYFKNRLRYVVHEKNLKKAVNI